MGSHVALRGLVVSLVMVTSLEGKHQTLSSNQTCRSLSLKLARNEVWEPRTLTLCPVHT